MYLGKVALRLNRGKWNGKDIALKRIRLLGGYDTEELANMQEIAILRYESTPFPFENQ